MQHLCLADLARSSRLTVYARKLERVPMSVLLQISNLLLPEAMGPFAGPGFYGLKCSGHKSGELWKFSSFQWEIEKAQFQVLEANPLNQWLDT